MQELGGVLPVFQTPLRDDGEIDRATLEKEFDWLFAKDRHFMMQRAVALTAAVVLAVSGFMLGGDLGQGVASERYASNLPQTSTGSSSTSNELTEFLVSDGI